MRRGLGEILAGDRTYFPLPVAYANNRAPIIPAQLRPLPVAAADRGLGDYFEEQTVTGALKPAATVVGIPLVGWALILAGAFGIGMLQGWAERPKSARRRRK